MFGPPAFPAFAPGRTADAAGTRLARTLLDGLQENLNINPCGREARPEDT